jgi:hypothetical protein
VKESRHKEQKEASPVRNAYVALAYVLNAQMLMRFVHFSMHVIYECLIHAMDALEGTSKRAFPGRESTEAAEGAIRSKACAELALWYARIVCSSIDICWR